MFLKYFVAFALLSVAYCLPAEPKIRFGPADPEAVQRSSLPKDWKTTVAAIAKDVPIDDGRSNYGDLIHLQRQPGDMLVYTEIFNTPASISEQAFIWKGNFPGITITQIRCLNFGRQRIWTSSIASSGSYGEASVSAGRNIASRFIVDVYGLVI